MELHLIESYRQEFPQLARKELTDALIRRILQQRQDSPVRILRTPQGKPYLEGGGPFISVSHTEDVFALAVDSAPLGLDIQRRRDVKARRIGRRMFTEEEQAMLDGDDPDAFFRVWTRKEAYGKLLGTGLAGVMDRVPVYGRQDVVFTDLDLGDGLYACICQYAEKGTTS